MGRTFPILVTDGGQLKTSPSTSLENVGATNFSRLINLRRSKDQLIRREGWKTFVPVGGSATPQYTFDGTETLIRLAELERGDGTTITVGASKTLIKRFDTATGTWLQIGSGFSASGAPWQAVALTSVLILNNGVDLPVTYEIGDSAVKPLYEAREQGVACCALIAPYNGFLFLGDVTFINDEQLAPWMNGYAAYTVGSTSAKAANFTIAAPGDRGVQFNVTTGAGAVLVTLPAMASLAQNFYVWIKKVDAGAGVVTTSPPIVEEPVVLDSINDVALVEWNGSAWVATVFPSGVIPASAPYGIVPANIIQEIPDAQAWSDFGDPQNFSPLLITTQLAASQTIYLPFVPHNWIAGQTRVAVVGGGDGYGTLGGQSAYPLGVLITAIGTFDAAHGGVPITIEVTTDTLLTYPVQVAVTRWTDTSTEAGRQRLGNGERITAMYDLNGLQIVSHTSGFFINRYTGDATAPFALREKYSGDNVPMAGDCITAYNTDFIVYPTKGRFFYQFDGISDPAIHQTLDDAKDWFFANLVDTDRIWAINNSLTNEIWFVRPGYVLTFSYAKDSPGCGEIDAQIDAACELGRPAGNEKWFALGVANLAMVYGLVNGKATTWLRNGTYAIARYVSGLQSFGADQIREKTLQSYTPLLSSACPPVEITVQLRMTHSANGTLVDKLVPPEVLPNPQNGDFIPLNFQENFTQDDVSVTDVRDVDFRVSGRVWEVDAKTASGVTRRVGI